MNQNVLEKSFLTNTDIVKLLNCSPSKASRIRNMIKQDLQKQGKKLVINEIPTHLFVDLMNLNVESINFEV